jgi:hypothetical protein
MQIMENMVAKPDLPLMAQRRRWRLGLVALLLIAAGSDCSQRPTTAKPPLPRPGVRAAKAKKVLVPDNQQRFFVLSDLVVVDKSVPAIFLVKTYGEIEALRPKDGSRLWMSKAAVRPIFAVDGRLVAQTGQYGAGLQLRILDANRGGASVGQALSIPLPAWAQPSLMQHPRYGFSVGAIYARKRVFIRWEAGRGYWGGPQPTEEMLKAANRSARGVAALDPQKGTLREATAVDGAWPKAPELYGYQWTLGPHQVGAVTASLRSTVREQRQTLTIRRRRSGGGALTTKIVAEGPLGAVSAQFSADGRHLLVSQAEEGTSLHKDPTRTLYDVASGAEVAELQPGHPDCVFFVDGELLIAVVWVEVQLPRKVTGHQSQLRATRIEDGTVVWKVMLLETRYQGPKPS